MFKKGLQRNKDLIHQFKPEWGKNEIAQKVSKTSFKLIASLTNVYIMYVSLISVHAYASFASWKRGVDDILDLPVYSYSFYALMLCYSKFVYIIVCLLLLYHQYFMIHTFACCGWFI